MRKFRVGLTRDFLSKDGNLVFKDIGLKLLDEEDHIEYDFFRENLPVVAPEQVKEFDAIIALAPQFNADTFKGAEKLIAIARFGVGYEKIDLKACTQADVLLFITPGGVRRPVAEGIITLMLALAKKIFIKDQLVRQNRWNDRIFHMGVCLFDRTLGSVGLGNIGSEMFRIIKSFGMKRLLAHDPYASKSYADSLGVELVSLETVMRESDFLTINCPLSHETGNLVGEKELALMKPTSYLINTSRGGIVDQQALVKILQDKKIAGAALDVFEREPVEPNDPVLSLDNVILLPHAVAWTDECFRDNGIIDCQGILKISRGEVPDSIVNKEVLQRSGFQKKLQAWASRS